MNPILGTARKTDLGLRSAPAPMHDLSTIAFIRTGALLRCNGPVPGILAAHRSRAIMGKPGRPRVTISHPAKIAETQLVKAAIITYEEYYPYGSTSFEAAEAASEVSKKRFYPKLSLSYDSAAGNGPTDPPPLGLRRDEFIQITPILSAAIQESANARVTRATHSDPTSPLVFRKN